MVSLLKIASLLIEDAFRWLLAHVNVTTHPSAAWTLQQLREVIADANAHRYLIHDREASSCATWSIRSGRGTRGAALAVLEPPRANAICERVIGTIRSECLDWMIPLSEAHLRSIQREWVAHYNRGRPHSGLGPGVPGPPTGSARAPRPEPRPLWTPGALVRAKSVLADSTTNIRFRRGRRSVGTARPHADDRSR